MMKRNCKERNKLELMVVAAFLALTFALLGAGCAAKSAAAGERSPLVTQIETAEGANF